VLGELVVVSFRFGDFADVIVVGENLARVEGLLLDRDDTASFSLVSPSRLLRTHAAFLARHCVEHRKPLLLAVEWLTLVAEHTFADRLVFGKTIRVEFAATV
jgi:hypothetical protein